MEQCLKNCFIRQRGIFYCIFSKYSYNKMTSARDINTLILFYTIYLP